MDHGDGRHHLSSFQWARTTNGEDKEARVTHLHLHFTLLSFHAPISGKTNSLLIQSYFDTALYTKWVDLVEFFKKTLETDLFGYQVPARRLPLIASVKVWKQMGVRVDLSWFLLSMVTEVLLYYYNTNTTSINYLFCQLWCWCWTYRRLLGARWTFMYFAFNLFACVFSLPSQPGCCICKVVPYQLYKSWWHP